MIFLVGSALVAGPSLGRTGKSLRASVAHASPGKTLPLSYSVRVHLRTAPWNVPYDGPATSADPTNEFIARPLRSPRRRGGETPRGRRPGGPRAPAQTRPPHGPRTDRRARRSDA